VEQNDRTLGCHRRQLSASWWPSWSHPQYETRGESFQNRIHAYVLVSSYLPCVPCPARLRNSCTTDVCEMLRRKMLLRRPRGIYKSVHHAHRGKVSLPERQACDELRSINNQLERNLLCFTLDAFRAVRWHLPMSVASDEDRP
jgi:hypothetical protein